MPDSTAIPPSSDLHYVDDSQPGYTRKLLRGKFAYFDIEGNRIRDEAEIKRINTLAIPPAYTEVWICADPAGHLQATGRDARGRKQYRYHPRWREIRDQNKYARLIQFGHVLPKVRRQIEAQLAQPGMGREKVMATVVSLLDATLIRIGNSQYAKENRSYGLTTLRNKHVEVRGGNILFEFRGKSGVEHRVSVKDRRLANVIKRCMELPGQNLFQYLDDDGLRHNVTSSDINAYLHNLTGSDFTAKDYRTWAASAHALATLRKLHWEPEADAKKHIVQVVKEVSKQLGNTPAICRKCYIHPAVLEGFLLGNLAKLPRIRQRKGLRQEEVALVHYLRALADKVEEAIEEAQA